MDSPQFLVPIRVQALVIDEDVTERTPVIQTGDKFSANANRWSPWVYDYRQLIATLNPPGPPPFYGAKRTYQNKPAEQLVWDKGSDAPAKKKDRGVYLHWVLPSGLRSAFTPGLLDFPALPDHWLIVRFSQRGSTLKTKAWFVDGSAVATETGPANLLFADENKYTAERVGRVVPFEQFASANAQGKRRTITALGNKDTGSPTFTGFIAENRNILSWQDKLEDLREPNADGKVPSGTILTYSVIGWCHDPKDEPLAARNVKLSEQRDKEGKLVGWLIDPPGWLLETNAPAPGDLLKRRSVFHGMVAHINYWNTATYKGQMLGYPGAPPVGEVFRRNPPSFQVGVGNNAEDALVSLVSSSYSAEQEASILAKEQPNLWKALEAVIYRQPESLIKSWNAAPRDMTVHQNWFATRDAGKIWFIRSKVDNDPVFPKDPAKTAAQTAIEPTPEQVAKLDELNRAQSDADVASRELAALQQDLYARWWKLSAKAHSFSVGITTEDVKEYQAVVDRVSPLRTKRDQQADKARTLSGELENSLAKELELKHDAAPRFWTPADPVVVVKNCGLPTKHRFPRQHPCRLPEQIATGAEVVVDKKQNPNPFKPVSGIAEISAAAKQHLPACPGVLNDLLNEASIVEQAVRDLAERALPVERPPFRDAGDWQTWTKKLVNDLTWDGDPDSVPFDKITFTRPGAPSTRPDRLVELWVEQPWSPLFIDWQITWFPTPQTSTADNPFGPAWNFGETDFGPLNRESIPQTGYTVRGRSLLSPIDERVFKEPIDTLRELLHPTENGVRKDEKSTLPPMVREILSRYEIVWDKTLGELGSAGLMGQSLTGFHQSLLRRDVTRPRVTPDPARPWVNKEGYRDLDGKVSPLLEAPVNEGVAGERLAPPGEGPRSTSTPPFSFSMIRAGALRIDELWLVDDFGQSADLLGRTVSGSQSTGQIFHPRIRWHNDQSVFAMPPRILQPVRLNFRFTSAAGPAEEHSDPALRPICGWMFYNPLDQALVLCNRNGELMGHLVIVKDQRGTRINWEAGAGGVAIDKITNSTLRNFAESLVETTPSSKQRLLDLLTLIDSALARIRPATARRDTVLVGHPLALVNATIGLELFGKAWSDPSKPPIVREGTGDEALDKLRVRVKLGYSHNIEDGLVGYFTGGVYNPIVATQLPDELKSSAYTKGPATDPLRVGFGAPEQLTLLMDPWGSVQAACGIVPAKTITLAQAALDETVAQMETSFRVGPVLLQADRIALPTPAIDKGVWNFSGPSTNQTAAAVAPVDPKYFSDQAVFATEGRLLLLNEE
jgi:hypothetical protein